MARIFNCYFIVAAFLGLILANVPEAAAQQQSFKTFCAAEYTKTSKCPEKTCQLQQQCAEQEDGADICTAVCAPNPCPQIPVESCPQEFCAVMESCSGTQVCQYQMQGGRPQCGSLAYAGQDVECCQGFVRRCGVEFLDGSCDMKGENSVYNLPICIPCGDGVCSQFEDRCNCPEDCNKSLSREEVPEKFVEILRKQGQRTQPAPAVPQPKVIDIKPQPKKNFGP